MIIASCERPALNILWLDFQVYYSEETHVISVEAIEGKCEVRKKNDIPVCNAPAIFQHIFFCEHLYDPSKGSLKQVVCFLHLLFATCVITCMNHLTIFFYELSKPKNYLN